MTPHFHLLFLTFSYPISISFHVASLSLSISLSLFFFQTARKSSKISTYLTNISTITHEPNQSTYLVLWKKKKSIQEKSASLHYSHFHFKRKTLDSQITLHIAANVNKLNNPLNYIYENRFENKITTLFYLWSTISISNKLSVGQLRHLPTRKFLFQSPKHKKPKN